MSETIAVYIDGDNTSPRDLDYILKTKHYDAITIALKPNDPKYIIHEIKGFKSSP